MAAFSAPENFPVKFSLFGKDYNFTISPPSIDFSIGSARFVKSFKTQFGLDISGGTQLVLEADMKDVPENERVDALGSSKEVIERRVNFFGVSEPVVQTAIAGNSYRVNVELPGITNVDQAVSLLGQTAKLEFRELKDNIPESTTSAYTLPTLDTTIATGLTGKDLKKAQLAYSSQTGEPEISLEFTPDGAKKFGEITTKLIGKPLPVFLDGVMLTWPRVSTAIMDGKAVITGGFSRDYAKTMALQLNAGALPVPVTVVEKHVIGASLGQDSITRSVRAGFIGLAFVALYMVLLYGKLGLIADLALFVYGVTSLFLFRFIPIVLTLPGITGFLLSIGMAVDSNILIFERYKEELRDGKPWHIAIETAFGRAWDSIRDANVTTILTCLILYNPGNWSILPSSGMVRGFAATLFLGVVVSLFSGIIVSRTLIRVLYKGKNVVSNIK
jgi:preprotein translocase subunit SecD